MGSFSQKHGPCPKLHCAKNEVFHWEFLQFPPDLVTFGEEILDFCAVINLSSQEPLTVNPDLWKYGGNKFNGWGDARSLICHATSHNLSWEKGHMTLRVRAPSPLATKILSLLVIGLVEDRFVRERFWFAMWPFVTMWSRVILWICMYEPLYLSTVPNLMHKYHVKVEINCSHFASRHHVTIWPKKNVTWLEEVHYNKWPLLQFSAYRSCRREI